MNAVQSSKFWLGLDLYLLQLLRKTLMINIVSSSGLDPVCLHVHPDNISGVEVLKGASQQVGDVLRKEHGDVSASGLG